MFSLAEQVHRHPVRGSAAIGQHQNLAGSGNHVDAHRAKHALFGAGDISVAGAGDLVHLGHRGGAVSQRSHGLRAANRKSPGDACYISCRQHQGIFFAFWRWHHHDDFAHSGDMRWNGVHQHRRRVSRLAARHINAHAVKRGDFLAQQRAVLVAVAPAFTIGLLLGFMVGAHTAGSRLQCIALGSGNRMKRRLELSLRQLQRGHVRYIQRIETGGVFQHCRVAALLHIGQNTGHPLLDGGVGVGRPVQAGLELGFKRAAGG